MRTFSISNFAKLLFSVILISAFASGCSNSASSSHEEEHPEPEGVLLMLDGEIVVTKYPEEDLVNNFPTLTAGEQTALITVQFLDIDGEPIEIDEPESSLRLDISNTNVIEIEQPEGEEWAFRVVTLSEGTSDLTLHLDHDGHPDFSTDPFQIEVVAAE